MAYFLLRLNAPRPTFPADITDVERSAMNEHADYWRDKAAKGAAIAVGPVMDPKGAWGLGIVECEDGAAARWLADADPIAKAGLGFGYDVSFIPSIILRQPSSSAHAANTVQGQAS